MSVLCGKAIRIGAILLNKSLVAKTKIIGIITPIELVPIQDGLQPRLILALQLHNAILKL